VGQLGTVLSPNFQPITTQFLGLSRNFFTIYSAGFGTTVWDSLGQRCRLIFNLLQRNFRLCPESFSPSILLDSLGQFGTTVWDSLGQRYRLIFNLLQRNFQACPESFSPSFCWIWDNCVGQFGTTLSPNFQPITTQFLGLSRKFFTICSAGFGTMTWDNLGQYYRLIFNLLQRHFQACPEIFSPSILLDLGQLCGTVSLRAIN
jgi:hypothetical protein